MKTTSKGNSAIDKAAAKADRDMLFKLEGLICDLDLTIGVLFDICHNRLAQRDGTQLSGDEAEIIYFQLCCAVEASRDLKAAYYGEEAA